MKNLWAKKKNITTTQTLAIGVIISILIGAILLKLPISNNNGKTLSWLDSFFTSTSAVCITGLNTVVPATQFSTFGKIILLILMQLGGIGFMTIITLIIMIIKKKIYISGKILVEKSINKRISSKNISKKRIPSKSISSKGMTSKSIQKNIVLLIKKIIIYMLVIEILGAIFLSMKFIPEYGVKTGIFYAIFHSVSAVCNAGFDILGTNGLIKYSNSSIVSITLMILTILGGIGFALWIDVISAIKKIAKKNSIK